MILDEKEKAIIKNDIKHYMDSYFTPIHQKNIDLMLDFWTNREDFVFAADDNLLAGDDIFVHQILKTVLTTDLVISPQKHFELIFKYMGLMK